MKKLLFLFVGLAVIYLWELYEAATQGLSKTEATLAWIIIIFFIIRIFSLLIYLVNKIKICKETEKKRQIIKTW
jgi:hypothetical protein